MRIALAALLFAALSVGAQAQHRAYEPPASYATQARKTVIATTSPDVLGSPDFDIEPFVRCFRSAGLTIGALRNLEKEGVVNSKLKRCYDRLIGL